MHRGGGGTGTGDVLVRWLLRSIGHYSPLQGIQSVMALLATLGGGQIRVFPMDIRSIYGVSV